MKKYYNDIEFNGNITVNGTVIAGTKQLVRTATVVVGLQSSGYSTGQVDVLIKPTDNVSDKITEAINKLPPIGGEIKFLEGTYDLANSVIDITKNNVAFSGMGLASKITSIADWLRIYAKGIVFKDLWMNRNAPAAVGGAYEEGEGTIINCKVDNTIKDDQIIGITGATTKLKLVGCDIIGNILKDGSNWSNIFVDGVAEFALSNVSIDVSNTLSDTGITYTPNSSDILEFAILNGNTNDSYKTLYYGKLINNFTSKFVCYSSSGVVALLSIKLMNNHIYASTSSKNVLIESINVRRHSK